MFNSDSDEYFLGPIVTFKNSNGKMEIIDGQQRLTTLMLLLRAFYEKYGSMKNDKAVKTSKFIEQCIWKTDEFGDPDKSALKIDSEVATDKEKGEFLSILKTGKVSDGEKSNYASNYRFFQQRIVEFLNTYPDWFSFFPIRIMIILWSNQYLESPACLNEMGAAWLAQSDYTNIYVPTFSFGNPKYHECAVDTRKMGAVLNGDQHCKASMLEFKDKIEAMFELKNDEKQVTYLLDQFLKEIGD